MSLRVYGARWGSYTSSLIGTSVAALPPPATEVDLRNLCTYVDDQIGQQCVGEALSGAHWGAVKGQGRRASHRGIYMGARVRERFRKSDPVLDVGCDPADAIDGMVSVGVYPIDDLDSEAAALNTMETWPEIIASKRFSPDDFAPIGTGDSDTAYRWLTAGKLIVVWSRINRSYENLGPSEVWQGITASDPDIGGHARVMCGYDRAGNPLEWGSWGTSYADRGFNRISRAVLESGAVNMVAVTGGPVL